MNINNLVLIGLIVVMTVLIICCISKIYINMYNIILFDRPIESIVIAIHFVLITGSILISIYKCAYEVIINT